MRTSCAYAWLVLPCLLLLSVEARADGPVCIGSDAHQALDACGPVGAKRRVSGQKRPSLQGALPAAKPVARRAPGAPRIPDGAHDPRLLRLKGRAMGLLIAELAGLEPLLARTPKKSPDRLGLMRRVAETYVEL